MSPAVRLSRTGGELLLRLAESHEPVILGQILNEMGPGVQGLRSIGALRSDGTARASLIDEEAGKQFADLHWDPARQAYRHFDPIDGFVEAEGGDLALLRMEMRWWLNWLSQSLTLTNSNQPTEIARQSAWDIGDLWITRQRKVPVIFARRLIDAGGIQALETAIDNRAGRRGGLIITSSSCPSIARVSSFTIKSVQELLANEADWFVIDRDLVLSPFIGPSVGTVRLVPLDLSPDGKRLVVHGTVQLEFRSERHIAVIRRLVEAYQQRRRCRAAELLRLVQSEAGSLRRLFGKEKWAALSPYLKSQKGNWGFEL